MAQQIIKKPIAEVVRQILSYADPHTNLHIFRLFDTNVPRIDKAPTVASLNDATTLNGDQYMVVHQYHAPPSDIQDPKDPDYLNMRSIIAYIQKGGDAQTETQIRFVKNLREDQHHQKGYAPLENLLLA